MQRSAGRAALGGNLPKQAGQHDGTVETRDND